MSTITYSGSLVVTSCWCGIRLAVPDDLYAIARRRGQQMFCPLGHSFVFGDTLEKQNKELTAQRDNAVQRAQQLRGLLDDERTQHHRTERRLQATRGVVTRTKRRIAAGACPKCHARFADLKDHMLAEHPDYVAHLG